MYSSNPEPIIISHEPRIRDNFYSSNPEILPVNMI
jgi:hypothetical protein